MEETERIDKVEVDPVERHVGFGSGGAHTRLIALLEGLRIPDIEYWLMQPPQAFRKMGETIRETIEELKNAKQD